MTAKGVRVGKDQPIRTCAAQHARRQIVGQQAGIDCDAATRAVRVSMVSGRPDVELVDTILMPVSRRKTFQDVPASIDRVRQRLEMARMPKTFQHAVIKVAVQKSDR
ncbi:MAG: hypothetical protein KKD25_04560 [Gammaproteobacteria bacterium]|nr:hypothetical protein [Gammaproteobacteria bacterium]MBU1848877.1 hypothetical protein [Gammaproteobacteria bacterium]